MTTNAQLTDTPTAPSPATVNPVLRVPAASPAAAAAYFAASLAFHADVSDVATAFKAHREQGAELGFQLVDSRSTLPGTRPTCPVRSTCPPP